MLLKYVSNYQLWTCLLLTLPFTGKKADYNIPELLERNPPPRGKDNIWFLNLNSRTLKCIL